MPRPNRTGAFNFIQKRSNLDLAIMDYALDCRHSECDIYEMCPYSEGYAKCRIHKEYMGQIINLLYRYEKDGKLTGNQLHIAGMTMVPLYNHLFRFQIAEMALATPVVYGKSIYMHPVYKEIRNTTKLLFDMWKQMGLAGTPIVPEKGSGNSVYDLLSAAEEEVAESVKNQTRQNISVIAEKEEGEIVGDEEEDDLNPMNVVNAVRDEIVGAKIRTKEEKKALVSGLEDIYAAQERLLNDPQVIVVGENGEEEEICIDPDFDPRNLENAAEIDPESVK